MLIMVLHVPLLLIQEGLGKISLDGCFGIQDELAKPKLIRIRNALVCHFSNAVGVNDLIEVGKNK